MKALVVGSPKCRVHADLENMTLSVTGTVTTIHSSSSSETKLYAVNQEPIREPQQYNMDFNA